MAYIKKIVGKRIYLSPMDPNDADKYVKWLNDKNVTDRTGNTNRIITEEAEREWLDMGRSSNFAIILSDVIDEEKNDGSKHDVLIGNCGINQMDNIRQTACVGIFIGDEDMRGKGYGTEAMNLLLGYCFDTLNIYNVMLDVFSFNEQAIASYKKCGFKEIGRRRQSYYVNGKRFDEVYMDILCEEFYQNQKLQNII